MFKLTVLYGYPADEAAFEAYYTQTHMPLAVKLPGLLRIEAAKPGPTPDGQRPAFYRTADLWFADQQQLQAALGSSEGQAAVNDLGNFASGGVTTLVSEITAAEGHV
jgi:uncharacterized protein (TIGR02118 family)